jgi:hypothetical protein
MHSIGFAEHSATTECDDEIGFAGDVMNGFRFQISKRLLSFENKYVRDRTTRAFLNLRVRVDEGPMKQCG